MASFDNFFDSSSLTVKLYERDLCAIFKAQKDRKHIPKMSPGRKMKKGDFEYFSSDKVVCSKWLDRRYVTMLLKEWQ